MRCKSSRTSHALAQLPHLWRQVHIDLRGARRGSSSQGQGEDVAGAEGRRAVLLRRGRAGVGLAQHAAERGWQQEAGGAPQLQQAQAHLDKQGVGVLRRNLLELGEQAAAGAARRLEVVNHLCRRGGNGAGGG